MGRPQLVSDAEIRAVALALLQQGVTPSVARVRATLAAEHGAGGEPARISRAVKQLSQELAGSMSVPQMNPAVPESLLMSAGEMVARLYAQACEQAGFAHEEFRRDVEQKAAREIAEARAETDSLRQANATLMGRLDAGASKLVEMEAERAALLARIERQASELASALASLEAERKAGVLAGSNANARISELESALEAKPDQPAIDVDALVERISQAAKRSES